MHFTAARGILSAQNGMNLFRGCTHGCIYCDSRSLCYGMDHAFEDVEVKINAPELLLAALRAKRKPCMIGTGAMSDPYIPFPETLAITRQCLSIIDRHGFGLAIQTKSARILQDMELLRSIHEKSKCVVQMTLTTFDEALCRILEPNVSTTRERFEALLQFRAAGIPTVVWLSPILPFLNDTEENLRGILSCCVEAGVRGILCFGMGLTLRDGNREYFYQKLDAHFPGLRQKYERTYGLRYEVPSPNSARLMRLFHDTCAEHGILSDPEAIFAWMHTYESKRGGEQLSLF
ncbi:radical SAM protein [bacterium]|nr:radical SAM protein [bacterium]